ncbi:hypothetical protein [Niabella aurantiaca]|uniref:hypothetical protein n=1 Tax=Niabella aurantiaca TaxID=379900 RepID=UPI0003819F53|nr:hypothetical protein [Niabella aurantiaca]
MEKKQKKKEETIKPDPETLHNTDPQEHMEGPVSTPMQKLEEVFEPEQKKKVKKRAKKNP